MKLITRAQAHTMKSVGTNFLQDYINRGPDSRTFKEWIEEEYQALRYVENSNIQGLVERHEAIDDMLQHGMVINKAKAIILGLNGEEQNAHDLNEEKNELITKIDDAHTGSFVRQMGMYMCAKQKLESRSLLSKIFHPFRTYAERNILSDLKNSIKADFNIQGDTFDTIVAFAEDRQDLAAIGAVTDKGTLIHESLMIDDDYKEIINNFEKNEKFIDDAELKKETDAYKEIPDFNKDDILDMHDDEDPELNNSKMDLDTVTQDEFIKGLEHDVNDLGKNEEKLSPSVESDEKTITDITITIPF